jgi:hypothetical protein
MKMTPYDGRETYNLVARIPKILDDSEVTRTVDILNYVLTTVGGEGATLREAIRRGGLTYVIVDWDSTKSSSDDLGLRAEQLRDDFAGYIQYGTPIRSTNRAGAGTKGTRLISGLDLPNTLSVARNIVLGVETNEGIVKVKVKLALIFPWGTLTSADPIETEVVFKSQGYVPDTAPIGAFAVSVLSTKILEIS